jgi:hypothetical protein
LGVVGLDQGVEQVFKAGVFVGELVAPQAGFGGEGLDGELAVGAQRRAEQQPGHGLGDRDRFGAVDVAKLLAGGEGSAE